MAKVMQLSLVFLVRKERNISADFLVIIHYGSVDNGFDVFLSAVTLKKSFDSENMSGFSYFELMSTSFIVSKTAGMPVPAVSEKYGLVSGLDSSRSMQD